LEGRSGAASGVWRGGGGGAFYRAGRRWTGGEEAGGGGILIRVDFKGVKGERKRGDIVSMGE
jgi:hypothetical protein